MSLFSCGWSGMLSLKTKRWWEKRLRVTEHFQRTEVRYSFMEMSNHPIERERGKLKTRAVVSCQFLSDKCGIFFMCPCEDADSYWSTCSSVCNSLMQKHSMWKCSDKILLLHQHSFRFKSFVNSSELNWGPPKSKLPFKILKNQQWHLVLLRISSLEQQFISCPIKSMLIMIIIANKQAQGVCITDFWACNSYFMKD